MPDYKFTKWLCACVAIIASSSLTASPRERVDLNNDWRFYRYADNQQADALIYDTRPAVEGFNDSQAADTRPTDAVSISSQADILKPWILPSGNAFINDPAKRHTRPAGNPGEDFPFVQHDFNDADWQAVTLPHDWAIAGPFYTGDNPKVGGGMGRLPSHGVAWYRKQFTLSDTDKGKQIYLHIDGAMSYSMVWLNGKLVGGWPYGYSSYRLDLTPYVSTTRPNQLAIRLDNPPQSSRWYPGAGIYRNVWLEKTSPVHVSQWGTQVITPHVTAESADISIKTRLTNNTSSARTVTMQHAIYELSVDDQLSRTPVQTLTSETVTVQPGRDQTSTSFTKLANPKLWGPAPQQTPHRYAVVTTLKENGNVLDQYTTAFGIRDLQFDPNKGVFINGEQIPLQGVNQHHDLGALGAAFNVRAAERQLEILQEMGVNAIRMAHNPPAPELLTLTDKMGILVLNESFDSWYKKKTPLDFHLIFADWHEQDLRALVRRDKNHPSVIMWYIGNEVGEQYTGEDGAKVALALKAIVKSEDPTRPVTASMNWAKADFPFSAAMDLISLNYQGEGIRQAPEFEGTNRIRTPPSYPAFHKAHPDKVILSSETASAFSSRGIYLFPVTPEFSAPVRDGRGGDSRIHQVSSYELHAVDFGSSADKVFRYIDTHPYVAGQFVWNGFDYIGEPTPYYSARSSYSGMIDLAGFKKDRFYLYQSQWRPDLPMAHILPHWNWQGREGEITPIHVFTSGDEVELFINGESKGRKKKAPLEYRIRFDDIRYTPGSVEVIAYKDGKPWAHDRVETTGPAAALAASADRSVIHADGRDLSFVTVDIVDEAGRFVPTATHNIAFTLSGPGRIVATDNGDSTDFTPFVSHQRNAFSGKVLVIIQSENHHSGDIVLTATNKELGTTSLRIRSKQPAYETEAATMIGFYKRALYGLLILLVTSIVLVLIALDQTFLSSPLMPRQASTYGWFSETDTDQYDGGSSTAFLSDDSFLLDAELRLTETIEGPYTAVSMVFHDANNQRIHRDLSAYQQITFQIKCSTNTVLTMLVYTVDPVITQPHNYLTYRAPHSYFNCSSQWQPVTLDLTDMTLPAWWLHMFNLNLADNGYSLEQVAKIQLGTTAQSPLNETIRVQVNSLTLRGEDWQTLYLTAGLLILLWLGYIVWFVRAHGHALVSGLQHKILSERPLVAYQQLSLAPHRNTPSDAIIRYLAEHFSNPDLNVEMAVNALGINRTKMNELLKAELGLTFTGYLNKLRLAEASRLLSESDSCNIADIAYTVGYKNISYFNKLFKEEYGCTPKSFKQHFDKASSPQSEQNSH